MVISKKRRLNKDSFNAILFYFAYSIYLVTAFMNISFLPFNVEEYGKIMMIACAAIIIFKELFLNTITRKELLYLLISTLLSAIIFFHTNGFLMFPLFILIYGSRKIPFEKIAGFSAVVLTILLIAVVISAKTGLILDYVSFANGRERDFLGFRYALFPSMVGLNITALITYLNKNNNFLIALMLLICNFIIFGYTDSRLSFAIAVMLIASAFLIRNRSIDKLKKHPIFKIMPFSYVLCSIVSLSLIFSFSVDNAFIVTLDEKIEHRISLGHSSLDAYPINLFGHNVEYSGAGLNSEGKRSAKKYNYVDCLYLNILEKYGVVYFVSYIAILTISMIKLRKRGDIVALIIMCLFAIIGLLDDLSIYLHYNSFIFISSLTFSAHNNRKEQQNEI